jgi:hypothetical protein
VERIYGAGVFAGFTPEIIHMIKTNLIAAAVIAVLALASSPSSAAMMGCSGDNMMKVNNSLSMMADGAGKSMGYKEISMAQSDMLKGNMRGCAMHTNKAMMMGMMKSGM